MDTAQTIAEEQFLPRAADLDAHEPRFSDGAVRVYPRVHRALAVCADAGLFSAGFDPDVGGMRLPVTVTMLINGILAAANAAIAWAICWVRRTRVWPACSI